MVGVNLNEIVSKNASEDCLYFKHCIHSRELSRASQRLFSCFFKDLSNELFLIGMPCNVVKQCPFVFQYIDVYCPVVIL